MTTSASLFIIGDPSDPDFDYCTYLLNFFNRKFTMLKIKLNQIFINAEKSTDSLKEQLQFIEKSRPNDFIFVTTTNERNNQLMYTIIEENNNNLLDGTNKIEIFQTPLPLFNKRIFLLNKDSFHFSLAICLKYILKFQNNKYSFADQESLNAFISQLNSLFDQSVGEKDYKNESFKLKHLFSNYSKLIELKFTNSEKLAEFIKSFNENIKNNFINDNFLNADFYVYEFEYCSRHLKNNSKDILFLRGKIDVNSFLVKLKQSIETIEKCFREYKPEEICISFNGGKDCCVVLYLFYAIALRNNIKFPLNALLIQIKNQFKEMNEFVDFLTKSCYKKKIIEFIYFNDSKSMKDSLTELKENNPRLTAILMGTRRTDGDYLKNLPPFAYTDNNWPRYMRVNPILDWSFSEVWYFIRILELPYCSLYDHGFTSIDNTLNTVPNKDLLSENGVDYLPAWMLANQQSERYSRKKM